SCIAIDHLDAGYGRKRLVVIDADELLKDALGITHFVERLDGLFTSALVELVYELDVFLLDVRAVHQHDAAQVTCGVRRINAPPEAVLVKLWQQAGVVDVRVRKENRVD